MTIPNQKQNQRLAKLLLVVVCGAFGFGYALVPIYGWVCDITGFNGTTGRVEAAALDAPVDVSREVTVQFLTTVNGQLPWEFRTDTPVMKVVPGQVYEAIFQVRNRADEPVIGQATPSVAPLAAAAHFNKTECFCFSQQRLEANETRPMPVRFVVNERLPKHIKTLTLSYTFFETSRPNSNAG
ncbi:MAG: cytochrome c oxidase assembly protein subunit 11 [Gammaproteobacteria bacterium]|jgi:cytochrome c oxidase assembly protein subunit 11